jgi:hypothetical protein
MLVISPPSKAAGVVPFSEAAGVAMIVAKPKTINPVKIKRRGRNFIGHLVKSGKEICSWLGMKSKRRLDNYSLYEKAD